MAYRKAYDKMNSEDSVKPNKTLEVALLCGELAFYSLVWCLARAVELAARALPGGKPFKTHDKSNAHPA